MLSWLGLILIVLLLLEDDIWPRKKRPAPPDCSPWQHKHDNLGLLGGCSKCDVRQL